MKSRRSLTSGMIYLMMGGVFASFLMFFTRPVAETLVGIDLVRLARGVTLLGVGGLAIGLTLLKGDVGWIRQLVRGPTLWFTLYTTWAAISITFSGDVFLSTAKVFELGIGLLVVCVTMHWTRSEQELDRVWSASMLGLGGIVSGYLLISIIAGIPLVTMVGVFPKYSGFGGGPGGANGMAQIGSILALFGISRSMAPRDTVRPRFWSVIALGLAIMMLSYSRGSMLIFSMMVVLLLAGSRRYVSMILISGLALAGILSIGPTLVEFALRGQDVSTFLTLTGRIDFLWVAGFGVFATSPLIGHGYYYATTYLLPVALVDGYDVTISNVDNTFLEIAMNLGLVGEFLFLGLWVSVGSTLLHLSRKHSRLWRVPMVREAILMIIATFIRSWINPTIAYHHWNTFVFLIAVGILVRCIQLEEVGQRPLARHGTVAALG